MKLFLIDGNSLLHRAFHALPRFTTSQGEVVNAVYGFISILLHMVIKEHPDYLAVAWDRPGKTFRHEAYEAYKATRVKPPDELYEQLPRVKELMAAFRIPSFEMDGYEADDILGTLAAQAKRNKNLETYIATADKDLLQLVDERTYVYFPSRGTDGTPVFTAAKVQEKYGLAPSQMIDFKALIGDPSDNIFGVKGIGPKGATEFLRKFGSLENIYRHADEIKGAARKKLEEGKESAFQAKRLVTILRDAPISLDLEQCEMHRYDRDSVMKLFEKLEFRKMISRLDDFEKAYSDKILEEKGIQPSLF